MREREYTGTMNQAARHEVAADFLPRFCAIRALFAVVVLAQVLSFVLVLARLPAVGDPWRQLALISLFVQWVALGSVGLLCLARPLLARLHPGPAALISYLLVLLVTALASEVACASGVVDGLDGGGGHGAFILRNLALGTLVSGLALRYFYLQHRARAQVRAEARARADALQARIRPHFLFNSLNTVAALTLSDPARAEEVVQDLADLFRVALKSDQGLVPLADELEVARRYLRIEGLRLGRRLRVRWREKPLPPGLRVPPLILQPLLENAIYHGIEPRQDGGELQVLVSHRRRCLYLEVRNPLPPPNRRHRGQGHHMAVANIQQRLALAYAGDAGVTTEVRDDEYRVRLAIPEDAP